MENNRYITECDICSKKLDIYKFKEVKCDIIIKETGKFYKKRFCLSCVKDSRTRIYCPCVKDFRSCLMCIDKEFFAVDCHVCEKTVLIHVEQTPDASTFFKNQLCKKCEHVYYCEHGWLHEECPECNEDDFEEELYRKRSPRMTQKKSKDSK